MKKSTSAKILAVLIALIFVFSACPLRGQAADTEKSVAKVSYMCVVRSPGHCWIYVENISKKTTLTVGAYELAPGEGVSIGTFGPTRYDGYGIYYNIEAYCETQYGMSGCKTLTEEVTASELKQLSDGILSFKNSWSPFRNCIAFAAQMWNLVSEKKMSNLIFPAFSSMQMFFKGCSTDTVKQKPVTADEVYRQRGTGSNAYLDGVKKISLGDLA